MPKVTLYFDDIRLPFSANTLENIGRQVRPLVAGALSFGESQLHPEEDVDFIVNAYSPESQVFYPASVEIETIGYPERKAMLGRAELLRLKLDILSVLREALTSDAITLHINPTKPLIWLKYVDPDGLHI